MKVDLHVHTCYSRDLLISLESVVVTCRQQGLDKVAITDHNTIAGALALREMAPELVVVGEEIKTPAGEIIAYFLEEEIPRGLSPQETIARIRAQGGVVGVPHPLDRLRREAMRWANLMKIIDQVDALEAFNARTIFPADNQRAEELARSAGIKMMPAIVFLIFPSIFIVLLGPAVIQLMLMDNPLFGGAGF